MKKPSPNRSQQLVMKSTPAQSDNTHHHLLNLKDENMKLKSKKVELEDEVKMIATRLKRTITQLKRDKIIGKGG